MGQSDKKFVISHTTDLIGLNSHDIKCLCKKVKDVTDWFWSKEKGGYNPFNHNSNLWLGELLKRCNLPVKLVYKGNLWDPNQDYEVEETLYPAIEMYTGGLQGPRHVETYHKYNPKQIEK